ncbi:hypothetical protein AVEN_224172-1 [Araneus ventricosus]|uniref:Uncharacterized protein n=1 Tax=Araneus ventricosus TaxID=182803 RepID=A0A4Y2AD06_ARAVE|nr:hypothetical protein AVEN_224172-1 [Araneus ventricosus]
MKHSRDVPKFKCPITTEYWTHDIQQCASPQGTNSNPLNGNLKHPTKRFSPSVLMCWDADEFVASLRCDALENGIGEVLFGRKAV